MSKRKTQLYFESHVTIEPIFNERLEEFKALAEQFGFRVADLLFKKREQDTPERSAFDTFCTTRSTAYKDIRDRTEALVLAAQEAGFKVWRYKIEDTLLDVRLKTA